MPYTGFDVLSEKTTQQTIKDIEAAGDKVKDSITTEVRRYVTSMTSSSTTYYTVSSSGTTRPTSGWATAIPAVPAGQYLWTRINITFTLKENIDGTITNKTLGPYYLYSVARSGVDGKNGQDGLGAVAKVNNISPTDGNVTLTANNIEYKTTQTAIAGTVHEALANNAVAAANAQLSADGKQTKINTSGILKGLGSGSITKATAGQDYGAMVFEVTLTSSGWNASKEQSITSSNILETGYTYIVDPKAGSRASYVESDVYADDSTTYNSTTHKGTLKFYYTGEKPESDLVVKIVRVVSA